MIRELCTCALKLWNSLEHIYSKSYLFAGTLRSVSIDAKLREVVLVSQIIAGKHVSLYNTSVASYLGRELASAKGPDLLEHGVGIGGFRGTGA